MASYRYHPNVPFVQNTSTIKDMVVGTRRGCFDLGRIWFVDFMGLSISRVLRPSPCICVFTYIFFFNFCSTIVSLHAIITHRFRLLALFAHPVIARATVKHRCASALLHTTAITAAPSGDVRAQHVQLGTVQPLLSARGLRLPFAHFIILLLDAACLHLSAVPTSTPF